MLPEIVRDPYFYFDEDEDGEPKPCAWAFLMAETSEEEEEDEDEESAFEASGFEEESDDDDDAFDSAVEDEDDDEESEYGDEDDDEDGETWEDLEKEALAGVCTCAARCLRWFRGVVTVVFVCFPSRPPPGSGRSRSQPAQEQTAALRKSMEKPHHNIVNAMFVPFSELCVKGCAFQV